MVVYSRIPYAVAQQAGRIQAKLLDTWCAGIGAADDLDPAAARETIRGTLTPFLEQHGARLDY